MKASLTHTHKKQEGMLGQCLFCWDNEDEDGGDEESSLWMRMRNEGSGYPELRRPLRRFTATNLPRPRAQEQQASPPHLWGSSLYHLLTCCSVNLSSSPRPKTSELRGSSLSHHLLTLVNFYQLLARTGCSGQLWIWPPIQEQLLFTWLRERIILQMFLTFWVILVPSPLNFKPPSCPQYSQAFLLLFQVRVILKR